MRRIVTLIVIGVCCVPMAAAQRIRSASTEAGVESIYLARSVRQSRAIPTAYCAQERVGFGGTDFEDQYTLQSVATQASDGLLTDAGVNGIGHMHACVARASDPPKPNFYAEGAVGAVSFKAFQERPGVERH
jgi:hypothetical protein